VQYRRKTAFLDWSSKWQYAFLTALSRIQLRQRFADLGLPDAEQLKIKSGLVIEITRAGGVWA